MPWPPPAEDHCWGRRAADTAPGEGPFRPEEEVGSPGTGVTVVSCCLELNMGPLEEQPVLLTTEPALKTRPNSVFTVPTSEATNTKLGGGAKDSP